MNERIKTFLNSAKERWKKTTKKQRLWLFTGLGVAAVALIALIFFSTYKPYAPLYSDLSPEETGQIKQTLEAKGIPYKIGKDGTTISVPKDQVDDLKVELAAEGLPKTGQIDYSFFGKNANFGMTDKQFDVLERAAVQTELSNLISGISGVQSAKVMINMPKESVWVSDKQGEASASIVLRLKPGYHLTDEQVNGLYHLVSKSVPNLPEDNIVIMDQNFNYYDKNSANNADSTLSVYQQQQEVKKDIEKDIQRRVQQMLGMMMGMDKVLVNVTTDIDFTKQKTSEDLVEPVDPNTMQGLAVSTEHITESYQGSGAGGVVGTGNNQVPGYQSGGNGNGNYQRVEDRINYEFNKIHNDIQKSPYQIKDLGIQVMVEPPNPNNPASLSNQTVQDIKQILNTIITTSLGDQASNLTPQQIANKSVVTVEKFNGKVTGTPNPKTGIPLWLKIASGVAVLLIIVLIFVILRLRRREEDEERVEEIQPQAVQDQKIDLLAGGEQDDKRRQLEELARKNPAEFAKLLRTWLSED
ncbi:flagellar basal-body MS-ring/collar protein FliF [Caenibacillus caldisaponilyticus]|uniref:flagellar basal-body MS-ring/collar protein FliF n=1 Tax=Caenibacillus caldisaponilyticus TaxID=1674942 RepID=UPI0009888061|nr:flagellar basal-body MS-ring/collar protein FliF [Caenibacillus caldisaponilyticus]